MKISVSEYNQLLNDRTHARFIQTNLHMHTPATAWDWNAYSNQTTKAEEIKPEDYFEVLNKTNLELVAITDHNCVEWCEPLIELARNAREAGDSQLHILPGVEITTYEGPHLITLFEEDFPVTEIRELLIRLKLSRECIEEDIVDKEITISHILREVDDMGGIALGPHVQSKHGLWGQKEFRGRTDVLNDKLLSILAAPSGSIKRVTDYGAYPRFLHKHMDSEVIRNSFAFIDVSDCHRLDDFELNATWLKMGKPSLEGVRQIIYEPELRISWEAVDSGEDFEYSYMMNFCPPPTPEHPHIIGMAVSGGMLGGQRIAFSPNQNCIIGKNYAGKSAVLDCIRFALNIVPLNDDDERLFVERLRAILGEGKQVRLYVKDESGKVFGLARTLLVANKGTQNNPKYKLDGKPEVYQLLENKFHKDSTARISEVFSAEVYPQGEVVKIKHDVSCQMSIVDSLARLDERVKRLETEKIKDEYTLYGRLIQIIRSTVELSKRIESIEAKLKSIPTLEAEIEKLEGFVDSPQVKEMQLWGEVDQKARYSMQNAGDVKKNIHALAQDIESELETKVDSEQQKALADVASASPHEVKAELDRLENLTLLDVSKVILSAATRVDTLIEKLKAIGEAIHNRLKKAEAEVQEHSKNTSVSEITELITVKKGQLNDLRNKQDERRKLLKDRRKEEVQLDEMKTEYMESWRQVRANRKRTVTMINEDSADNIEAKLIEDADRSRYLELLKEIVKELSSSANRFSNYSHLEIIADSMSPQKLAEIIRGGDANRLVELADGVTLNNARILMSMGPRDICRLELCVLGDRFEIGLRKEGDDNFTPIDGGLSGGEQALALISVAMIPKDRPLIIDQPEDELGPALITGELVEQIRRVKSRRQLVFVTHVPNIPVLGDSEQVVYVEQEILPETKETHVKCCGSLDDLQVVERLLELDGGRLAFDKRQKRYHRVMA